MFVREVKGAVGSWGMEMIESRRPVPFRPLQEKPDTGTTGNEDPLGKNSENVTCKKPLFSNSFVSVQNPNLKKL